MIRTFLILCLLTTGCATFDAQNATFKAQKALSAYTDVQAKKSMPEMLLFNSTREVKEIAERFTGKKFKKPAFFHPSSKTIYVCKYAASKIVIHEVLHAYLSELFPKMTEDEQHKLIGEWEY